MLNTKVSLLVNQNSKMNYLVHNNTTTYLNGGTHAFNYKYV